MTITAGIKNFFEYNIPCYALQDKHSYPVIQQFARELNDDFKGIKPVKNINSKVQRSLDIVIASGLSVVGAIPCSISALLLKLTNPKNPAIFKQERIGIYGRPFDFYKLGTINNLQNGHGTMSRFDQFIRKYSIDELPQLICVFKGDMSIVGPRACPVEAFYEHKDNIDFLIKRQSVKPGFGFGYVGNAKGYGIIDEEYESQFIDNMNLKTYLKTLKNLAKTVVLGRNS